MLFIGHSHLWALEAAAKASGGQDHRFIQLRTIRKPVRRRGKPVLTPEFARLVEEALVDQDAIVWVIAGNEHQVPALFGYDPPFDVMMTADDHVDDNRALVPYRAMEAFFQSRFDRHIALRRALRDAFDLPMVQLQSPPPVKDQDFATRFLIEHSEAGGEKLCPPDLRLKLWAISSAVLAAGVAAMGIELLPPPPEALDAEGYLRLDYAADPTHANAAYGALALAQAERWAA